MSESGRDPPKSRHEARFPWIPRAFTILAILCLILVAWVWIEIFRLVW